MLDTVDRITGRVRWTLLNRVDDLLRGVAVGIDPRVCVHVAHRRQTIGAETCPGTDVAVVEDRHLLARIVVALVGRGTAIVPTGECDLDVCPVTERPVGRSAAAAQCDNRLELDRPGVGSSCRNLLTRCAPSSIGVTCRAACRTIT
jgi:hypothetical protein